MLLAYISMAGIPNMGVNFAWQRRPIDSMGSMGMCMGLLSLLYSTFKVAVTHSIHTQKKTLFNCCQVERCYASLRCPMFIWISPPETLITVVFPLSGFSGKSFWINLGFFLIKWTQLVWHVVRPCYELHITDQSHIAQCNTPWTAGRVLLQDCFGSVYLWTNPHALEQNWDAGCRASVAKRPYSD